MNGKIIYFDGDELEDVHNLVCVCGHKLYEHACPLYFGDPNMIITSQCTKLVPDIMSAKYKFHCEQFRLE